MNKKAQRILETTIKLFLDEGTHKITMDQIAKNARASKVTVYKYFEDKEKLYYEIAKHLLRSKSKQLSEVILINESLEVKLKDYLDAVVEFSDTGHLSLCKELTKYSLEIEIELDTYIQVYKETMLTLIDKGIEEKHMKPELDRMMIFSYIDMGIEYYQNNADYRYKINNDSKFQESYMSFFMGNVFN